MKVKALPGWYYQWVDVLTTNGVYHRYSKEFLRMYLSELKRAWR